MLRCALLLPLCACHDTPKAAPPKQSEAAALTILCTSDGGLEQVTNPEVRRILDSFADARPWDIAKQILLRARDAGLADCHPVDALTAIRARNGVDVPLLEDDRGTVPADRGRTFAITRARITIEDATTIGVDHLDDLGKYAPLIDGPVAARFAVDRAVDYHAFAVTYDALRRNGVGDVELIVTTPTQTHALVLHKAKAIASTPPHVQTSALISVGAMIELDDKVVPLDGLRQAVAATNADRVFVTVDASVPMQRLAEVIAAAGGHVTLGTPLVPPVPPPIEQ